MPTCEGTWKRTKVCLLCVYKAAASLEKSIQSDEMKSHIINECTVSTLAYAPH